jgi:divalent metal cation (Fe/Co/Zn/Cd) transporter
LFSPVRTMSKIIPVELQPSNSTETLYWPKHRLTTLLWLQGITLAWMLAECGLSLYASMAAHSPAMLAFGADSLVELLSAGVVLLQYLPRWPISERQAARSAGVLLFVLSSVVAAVALLSLVSGLRPETSGLGIGITLAALVVMPVLATLKRREAKWSNNAALSADAVQSALCAYLAAIALAGLAINALFHIAWFDSLAALAAVPLLFQEGRRAWRGHACVCC